MASMFESIRSVFRNWGRKPSSIPPGGAANQSGNETWAKAIQEEFVLARKLGEGGMGTVFLVRSKTTGQTFAVKGTKLRDEKSRRNFLTELQTWLDLPEHPHLTACRFFRTVQDQVLVFAEYVDGGSLHDWIRQRKLTRLEQILDVAIQFAWGLHAAHEAGLVHQDVKPGNVLLTQDGLVKVSDFGLARARNVAGASVAQPGQSILVSAGGMTPAYCSPEQAAGRPLSRKTDVWSWGVSVLEMFAGQVSWRSGTVALKVLEGLLEDGPEDDLPAMPETMAEILRKCFRGVPGERWANMEAAAQEVETVYCGTIGRAYPRQRPAQVGSRSKAEQVEHDRRKAGRAAWKDPWTYLQEALRQVGRDPREAEAFLPARSGSRKGQTIADMAVYDEARQLFQQLIEGGRKDLENSLANLCHNKALVHEYADDMTGAVALYEQAIAILERLVNQEGRRELANNLANLYMGKALAVSALGGKRGTVALYEQAIAIRERLVNQEGRRELANDLANVYMNKPIAVSALGDKRGAVALYEQAIAIWERLVNQEGRGDLANLYMNKATAVSALGDKRGAVALYEKTIAIRERLVNQEGRRELQGDLAWVRLGRAKLLMTLGNRSEAQKEARTAVAVLKAEIGRTGRPDLKNVLDWAMSNLQEIL